MTSQVMVSDGIESGLVYGFRYRAANRQGQSDYSDVAYIMAANPPA